MGPTMGPLQNLRRREKNSPQFRIFNLKIPLLFVLFTTLFFSSCFPHQPEAVQEIRLGSRILQPQWNEKGTRLYFLTQAFLMGKEHIRDIVVWDGGRPRWLTTDRMIQEFWTDPSEDWITFEEYDPFLTEENFQWAVFQPRSGKLEIVSKGDKPRGAGVFLPEKQWAFFGEYVYHKDNGKWNVLWQKEFPCRKRENALVGHNVLFLCAGAEEGLLKWEENHWKPVFTAQAGTIVDWHIPPDRKSVAIVAVQQFGSAHPVSQIFHLDEEAKVNLILSRPGKMIQLQSRDGDWLYWFEKEPFSDRYDTEVVYQISQKQIREQQREKWLWKIFGGIQVYTLWEARGILWQAPAGFLAIEAGKKKNPKKILEKSNIVEVSFSPDGRRLAITGVPKKNSPDRVLYVIEITHSGELN
ncbi:MAG: hypothetical protein ACK4G3_02480 [bacterium]